MHYHVVKPYFPNLSEGRATLVAKSVCFLFGGIAIVCVLIVKHFGTGILSVSIYHAVTLIALSELQRDVVRTACLNNLSFLCNSMAMRLQQ